MKIKLPAYVISTARILVKEGYKAYLVGGALRDSYIGVVPGDYDVATDALPDDLIKIFPKAITVGAKFGTVLVIQRDLTGENYNTEVTTLRSEEEYIKGRWPSKVKFVRDIQEDLTRRDFTVNAMALDMGSKGIDYLELPYVIDESSPGKELNLLKEYEFELIDPFGGVKDLEAKIIRSVGNPIERFTEDGVRTYKACRLASQLGFTIDPETFSAISNCLTVARMISAERIRDEFLKLLYKSPKPSIGINLMKDSGLLKIFLPELLKCIAVEQLIGHEFDVYDHTLRTIDLAQDHIKLAALFHDIAKPKTGTPDGHFYGHDQLGAEMTKIIMQRLRFSTREIEHISSLVRWHMFSYPYEKNDINEPKAETVNNWTDGAVRRFINRVGLENIDDLFALRIADATSEPASSWKPDEITQLQERISRILEEDTALKVSDLEINGQILMKELKIKPSKIIGDSLSYLLEKVIDNPNLNNKETLLTLAKEFISSQTKN